LPLLQFAVSWGSGNLIQLIFVYARFLRTVLVEAAGSIVVLLVDNTPLATNNFFGACRSLS
jgi:hypothetical protein